MIRFDFQIDEFMDRLQVVLIRDLIFPNLCWSDVHNVMCVCKQWKALVIASNELWRKLYVMRFLGKRLGGRRLPLLRLRSWYDMTKRRTELERNVPGFVGIEGCEQAECPLNYSSMVESTLADRKGQRLCQHCKKYVGCKTSAQAFLKELNAGKPCALVERAWRKMSTHGRVYYYNKTTQQTQWSKPIDYGDDEEEEEDGSGKK